MINKPNIFFALTLVLIFIATNLYYVNLKNDSLKKIKFNSVGFNAGCNVNEYAHKQTSAFCMNDFKKLTPNSK